MIGDKNAFGIEVVSFERGDEYGDIFLCASGERISNGDQVFVPTFVGELAGVLTSHADPVPGRTDFSCFTDVELFNLFHHVMTTGESIADVTSDSVEQYHYLHSIDDTVDNWEIYICDVGDTKRIVWRGKNADFCPPSHLTKVWSSVVGREEFLNVLSQFLDLAGFSDRNHE